MEKDRLDHIKELEMPALDEEKLFGRSLSSTERLAHKEGKGKFLVQYLLNSEDAGLLEPKKTEVKET